MTPFARAAVLKDADAAVYVLRRSIVELCAPDHRHDPATLHKWLENKTVENFRAWVSSEDCFCVLTEGNGKVNGVGLVKRDGEIQLCYIAPGNQGRGFGSAILTALENEARGWGVQKVHLGSTVSARAFYEKHGYVSAGDARCAFGSLSCYAYEKYMGSRAHGITTP